MFRVRLGWGLRVRQRAVALLLLVFGGLGAAGVSALAAWGRQAPQSRWYVLRHAASTEIAPQIKAMLAGVSGSGEVAVDRSLNRLMVRGSDEAQRLASQLVDALDRPCPAPSTQLAAQEPSVARGYRVAQGALESAAAQLRTRYAADERARIAVDQRTGQLLVVAPESVHREIAAWVAANGGAAAETPPAIANPAFPAGTRVYQLQHMSWRELEDALAPVWGAGAPASVSRAAELTTVRLPSRPDVEAAMLVDHRRNQVGLQGPDELTGVWRRVVEALDERAAVPNGLTQVVRLQNADPQLVQRAVWMIREASRGQAEGQTTAATALVGAGGRGNLSADFVAKIFQPASAAAGQPAPQPAAPPAAAPTEAPKAPAGAEAPQQPGFLGQVQIEVIPGLDALIISGRPADVKRVRELIDEIVRQSAVTRPEIVLHPLQHVNGQAMADLVTPIYAEVFAPRQGTLSITPLIRPNALLLIGRIENIESLKELINKLDQPLQPNTQLKVFPLRFMSALDAEQRITTFFADTTGLSPRVRAMADVRSNLLIVQADKRDLEEVSRLILQLDVETTEASTQLQVFQLKNTLAADLQTVLQGAISRQAAAAPGAAAAPTNLPSGKVEILGIDEAGNRIVESGILSDVTVTADVALNALIVRGPAKSMDLIAELIKQLDQLPAAEAQIKVWTLKQADATSLATLLQQLFGQQVTYGTQGVLSAFGQAFGTALGPTGAPTGAAGAEVSLIPLRFAVDMRTNSLIVSGSRGDLAIVEAVLVRLDEADLRQRKTAVYRLNNTSAQDVATAIQSILTSETQLMQQQLTSLFGAVSASEFIARQVFVVAEAITNSLIVSATPDYYDRVAEVIAELDRRPPLVVIQVVIAELALGDSRELGVELGIQDSLLFDRGVASPMDPGFDFVDQPLGNTNSTQSLATRDRVAGQGFANFLVGRTSAAAGFPGLVLSASSESVNILIRALQSQQRLQVLSRPVIMTLNNVPAGVFVGQSVPRVTSLNVTTTGSISSTEDVSVGLQLNVAPRVTPEGLIVMAVEASNRRLEPLEKGIPIGVQDGIPILSPIIDDTTASATISAMSGQTVVFAGLIRTEKSHVMRGIPYLSDIPVLGRLFRFDTDAETRGELLVFLTPHLVDDEDDLRWVNATESERMSWCLADVVELAGDVGLRGGSDVWGPKQAPVIFPDQEPTAPELAPAPPPEPALALPKEKPPLTPAEELKQKEAKPYLTPPEQLKPGKPYLTPKEERRQSKPFIDRPQQKPSDQSRDQQPDARSSPAGTAASEVPAASGYAPPTVVAPVRYQEPAGAWEAASRHDILRLPAAR